MAVRAWNSTAFPRRDSSDLPLEGRSLWLFINNFSCHLTPIHVFGNGLVDCWGGVDWPLFLDKVRARWVVPAPASDQRISVHNLGSFSGADAEWVLDPEAIIETVDRLIGELNPERENLIDFEGTDTEIRDGARYAKVGLLDCKPIRRDADGDLIPGSFLPVIAPSPGEDLFVLTPWFLFADGQTRIGVGGPLLPFEEAEDRLMNGQLLTSVPDGVRLAVSDLGTVRVEDSGWWVDPEERIREARDEFAQLRGHEGAIVRCRRAFNDYQDYPDDAHRELLRIAYEAVPLHLRMYCGDMDTKDGPIRRILYATDQSQDEA